MQLYSRVTVDTVMCCLFFHEASTLLLEDFIKVLFQSLDENYLLNTDYLLLKVISIFEVQTFIKDRGLSLEPG